MQVSHLNMMDRRFTVSSEKLPPLAVKECESLGVAVMGDAGVGKSCLTAKLIQQWAKRFSLDSPTLGLQVPSPRLKKKGKNFTLEIIDTSSKKKFQFYDYLPTFDVYVLVYSLVSERSFRSVCALKDHILKRKNGNVAIVFVGTKSDIAKSRFSVDTDCMNNHGHVEVSAEKDSGISDVMDSVLTSFVASTKKMPSPKCFRKIKGYLAKRGSH